MDKKQMKKRFENFWYYYKWHTIIAIPIIISIIFVLLPGKAKTKEFPCNAILTGTYLNDSKRVEIEKKEQLNIRFLPMGEGISKDIENASIQKIMVSSAAGDYDLLIADKELFNSLANQGAFLELDDLIKINSLNDKSLRFVKTKVNSENVEHIYGIELNENKYLQDAKYDVKNKVVGIYANTKERNRAVRFITFLFDNFTN